VSKKIDIGLLKKIPPRSLLRLINLAKEELKEDETMQKVFDDFDLPIEWIDLAPVCFGDIDVSATTSHGIITLNFKLLEDGDAENIKPYLLHELVHVNQQTTGTKPTKGANSGDYMKNPYEQEAFQHQIEFIAKNDGEKAARTYTDKLLDHHDKKGKEKEELEDVLMEKV
jgi:hypothetical protein